MSFHRQFPSEFQVHRAVIEHLNLRARPGVLWIHVPNGELRDPRIGAKLRAMGTFAGASDVILWFRGESFALELKTLGGRLSDLQREFQARFADAGGHTAVAKGIDEALAVLTGWGLLR